MATGPNQIWSWDIIKLLGPAKWTYFHLYVILDIFSRNVVGWMVAGRETAESAKRLIAATCAKQGIGAGTLTIHADRGTSMTTLQSLFSPEIPSCNDLLVAYSSAVLVPFHSALDNNCGSPVQH